MISQKWEPSLDSAISCWGMSETLRRFLPHSASWPPTHVSGKGDPACLLWQSFQRTQICFDHITNSAFSGSQLALCPDYRGLFNRHSKYSVWMSIKANHGCTLALDIALGAYDEWRAGVGVRRSDCCCCCRSQLKKLSKEGVKQIF